MNITLAALAFSTLALTGCDSNAAQPQNTEQPHISAEMKQRHDACLLYTSDAADER